MEWRDEGIVLSVRKHGESGAIVEILTAAHGRCLGHVRGGRSRRQRPVLQPGNIVQAAWRARLEEHLGHFTIEGLDLKAGAIMEVSFRLAGLATLAALAQLLPEREPHRRVYDAMRVVLDAIEGDDVWPALMVLRFWRWLIRPRRRLASLKKIGTASTFCTQRLVAWVRLMFAHCQAMAA